MKITAIILAKNEEKMIENAIKSISFCDEVLVLDDNSLDATVKKAKDAGATVLSHSLNNNFADQRNWAIKQAKNDWIFFLDADEVVSDELKKEITSLPPILDFLTYAIPRRDYFWNTELKYGETQKARTSGIVRFIKKNSGTWKGQVHEKYIPINAHGRLVGFLNHYSHHSLSSFIRDINIYSTLRALDLAKEGKKVSPLELIIFPLGKFLYTYFMLRGFLDGPAGFAYSFVMSFHSFLVRAKLATKLYV